MSWVRVPSATPRSRVIVGLKDAGASRDDARKQQQRGADPVLERQLERLSRRFDSNDTFEVIAQEFHATKKIGWSDNCAKRWLERLAKDVFLWLGKLLLPTSEAC